MFKRQYRFPAQTKLGHPRSFVSQSFILKYAANNLSFSRLGFIISKKIDKRAVKRNQAKRKIRAYLESIYPQIEKGYDMLFILRQDINGKTHEEISKEVKQSLQKNNLIYENHLVNHH